MRSQHDRLANISIFRGLTTEQRADVEAKCAWKPFSEQQTIVQHEDNTNDVYFLVSGRADFTSRLTAATSPDALPEPDLVIVASKGGDVDLVATQLEGHWPGATLMTVQNGIGADGIVARHGPWPLLTAVTFMSGTRHADTHVEYVLDTATWIGPSRGTTPDDARAVAALIASSGLEAKAFDDLRPAQWSKLIFNATVNTVADSSTGKILNRAA